MFLCVVKPFKYICLAFLLLIYIEPIVVNPGLFGDALFYALCSCALLNPSNVCLSFLLLIFQRNQCCELGIIGDDALLNHGL